MEDLSEIYRYAYDPQVISTVAPPYHPTGKVYDLNTLAGRRQYFNDKAGSLIQKIKEFLEDHTFIAYWMAPKNAGKGTYIGLLKEIFGMHTFNHISVGDVVRKFQNTYEKNKKEYDAYFAKNYRGYIPLEDAIQALLYPDISSLKPTDLVLTLIKKEIDELERKTIFLDGFPRSEDQITYSLYLRELVNYREDPDLFVLIYLPLSVIDERIKYRRVCPKCGKSFNLALLPSEHVGYDEQKDEFYLMCDNPQCNKVRLVEKQGDNEGISKILPRIKKDLKLMQMAEKLYGIPKVRMYNALHVEDADKYVEMYEITKRYEYALKDGNIERKTIPWIVKDHSEDYYSLLAAPVLLQFLKQVAEIFELI